MNMFFADTICTVLDRHWLKDKTISNPARGRGLVVEFRGLKSNQSGWWAKADELEGVRGTVLAVMDMGGAYIPTATVLLKGGAGKEEPSVPLDLLVPVHPSFAEEAAVPLDGRDKGELVSIRMIDGNIAFVVPQAKQGAGFREIDLQQLCLWEPVEL